MPLTQNDIREIEAKVRPLIGKPSWGASIGIGSFITLECGASLPADQGNVPPRGEWHLWVYCCAWRLETANEVLAASEDPRTTLEAAVQSLNEQVVQGFKIDLPSLEATFAFESGIVLRLFPVFSQGYEHWMLYAPAGNILTIGPGTDWSYKQS